jgi:TIR domain/PAN domain
MVHARPGASNPNGSPSHSALLCVVKRRTPGESMAGKIFINYRRNDSIGTAGRLHDRLAQTFGRNSLFMDVDHVPAGVDFVDYLHGQVAACDVFLAVIGPNWLDAKDDDGRRRFDHPDDFVTIEIAAALARNIRVIPVLVDGARMPKADKLPVSVKPLVRRNAVEVRNTHFGRDADALVEKVREAFQDVRPTTRQRPFLASTAAWLIVPGQRRAMAGSAVALLLVGWIGLYQIGVPVWVPWSPTAEQANPSSTNKAAAEAEARRKTAEAEQQSLKEEEQRQAKAAADAEAKLKAAEAEQQRFKEEEQRQAKAAADAEARRKAAEAEQQRLAAINEEEQRQAKKADLEAKLKAAEAEQQRLKQEVDRQAKAAADAEVKRKAAEAEQQRLKQEVDRQAKAAADAEAKRKAAEAEQQRLAALKADEERKAKAAGDMAARSAALPANQPPSTVTTGLFTIRRDHEAAGAPVDAASYVPSITECEQKCARSATCKMFAYSKSDKSCYLYAYGNFLPNADFDSGTREAAALAGSSAGTTGLFTISSDTEATGSDNIGGGSHVSSTNECEQRCTKSATCKVFTYNKSIKRCYLYTRADFVSNAVFDSGTRDAVALPSSSAGATGLFRISSDTEATGIHGGEPAFVSSTNECEQRCAQSATCKVFTYNKSVKSCYLYTRADFVSNAAFDSGLRK